MLAFGIPFWTRPEPIAVRPAPTSPYVIHRYLQLVCHIPTQELEPKDGRKESITSTSI